MNMKNMSLILLFLLISMPFSQQTCTDSEAQTNRTLDECKARELGDGEGDYCCVANIKIGSQQLYGCVSLSEADYGDIEAIETATVSATGVKGIEYTISCSASYGKTCDDKKICDTNKNQICGDSKKCECKSGYEYDETNKECKLYDDSSRSEFISYKFLFAFIFFILF